MTQSWSNCNVSLQIAVTRPATRAAKSRLAPLMSSLASKVVTIVTHWGIRSAHRLHSLVGRLGFRAPLGAVGGPTGETEL